MSMSSLKFNSVFSASICHDKYHKAKEISGLTRHSGEIPALKKQRGSQVQTKLHMHWSPGWAIQQDLV